MSDFPAPASSLTAPVRYRCFGARHQLSQLPRIEAGLVLCGAVEAPLDSPEVDLIYANDEPRWQEAIEYRDRIQPKAKLILTVLDLPENHWESGFNPQALFARLQKADGVCAISAYVQSQLVRYFGMRSAVVYNPIKPITPARRLAGERPYSYRYLLAGRLTDPGKRVNLAIQALTYAGVEEKEVAVVGGENIGYGTNLGLVSDEMLNDLYNSVDFVVMTSLFEGLGLPALEGWAAGALPVITSDLTVFPEFYPRYWGCYPNPHSIAYRIRSLLDNPAYLTMEKASLMDRSQWIRDSFSGKAVAERILGVYERLIDPSHV